MTTVAMSVLEDTSQLMDDDMSELAEEDTTELEEEPAEPLSAAVALYIICQLDGRLIF